MGDFEILLNDLDSDPSALLAAKLDSVPASGRTVRGTPYVPMRSGSAAWPRASCRTRSLESGPP